MKKKLLSFAFFFLLFVPFLQGCGTVAGGIAVRELNQLNVVMITGVDYDPKHKKFILSIQSLKPTKEKNVAISPESAYTARATGDTIMEASKNLRAQTSGKLVWFHSKVIILGETLVKQKVLKEVVDFFARNREIRYSSWILVANGTAEDIVTAEPNGESTMGEELVGIINNQAEWGRTAVVMLRELINSYASPYEGFVTGRVHKYLSKDKEKQIIAITGASVIRNQTLVTDLSREEVRTLHFLNKTIQQEPEIVFSVPLNEAGSNRRSTAVQIKIKDRKKSSITNGVPKIDVQLSLDATVLESGASPDFNKEVTVAKLKKRLEERIQRDIRTLLHKMQKEKKVDIFEFNSLIHRQHKRYWHEHRKEWDTIYPNIPVHVSITWNTFRTGLINQVKKGEQS
ncbi:Ger(x)C family spore germination protein [Aneurinibacillus thermoaerophilus]|uniref:Ger(x)C family spore germination protein n=1 Tax=Aneurinibacillus thermoaerophilus TaxID=143495 RepID=UPI002E234949|nr:Ger(x)C family spore germination protein [Aneurinibacillus thermoaerophilus]